MPATFRALLVSTALLSTPALAADGGPVPNPAPGEGASVAGHAEPSHGAASANPAARDGLVKTRNPRSAGSAEANVAGRSEAADRRNAPTRMAMAALDDPSGLNVTTYRVVLPEPVTDPDPDRAGALWRKVQGDVRDALSGASQADARARLASLGDVSTALALVGIDATDDERDTLALSSDRQAYVKTVEVRPGRGEVGTVGQLQTGDRVRVRAASGPDGYHLAYDAVSRHLAQMDRFSTQGVSVDMPNVSEVEATGDLDLKAMAAVAGAGVAGPRPVRLDGTPNAARGVSAVAIRDTADRGDRTVIVYVFSDAR